MDDGAAVYDGEGIIRAARREVLRCQQATDTGSPRAFWLRRLGDYAQKLETAAAILRMEIAALAAREKGATKP